MALSDALKNHLAGIKITQSEIDHRKSVCNECPLKGSRIGLKKDFPYIGAQPICNSCGCYLAGALGKWAAAKEECPLNKW